MRRVVSLYLPLWSIDRLRRRLGDTGPRPDHPTVLAGRVGRRRLVVACDPVARSLGIRIGTAVSQAQALTADLQLYDADPQGDARALGELALWALRRYAPIAAPDGDDGLLIDVTGAAHLKGGEAGLVEDLQARLTAAGAACRIALAPTPGAAHAAARYRTGPTFIADGEIGRCLGDLPLAALRLSTETVGSLSRLGFETILDVESQPRAPLVRRVGLEIAQRLDQLFGRTFEPIIPVADPVTPAAERRFAEPIGAAETLARHLRALSIDLCGQLEQAGAGSRRFDLACHRIDQHLQVLSVSSAQPMRDVRRLLRLLTDIIPAIEPGFGIEALRLTATRREPLDWRPGQTALGEPDTPDITGLIDLLSNRLGRRRVYRIRPAESDVPERSVRRTAPLEDTGPDQDWPIDWPRPVRLLHRPEPVETLALLPDHPPAQFTWRGVRHRIRRADGPERIHGEWARSDDELWAVRDYFQVEDEAGERYWLFRAGDGVDVRTGDQRWFLHGTFG